MLCSHQLDLELLTWWVHGHNWMTVTIVVLLISNVEGLMADVLNGKNITTETYSIAGLSLWPQGSRSRPLIIDDDKGAMTFKDYAENADVLWNLTKHKYANAYADAYSAKVWFIHSSKVGCLGVGTLEHLGKSGRVSP